MKYLIPLIGVLATVAISQQPNPDQSFYVQAAEGGIAEVEIGKLAQTNAHSPAVKEFATQMVIDHGKSNAKLAGIAGRKQIALPTTLGADHQAMKKKLQGLSGEVFDSTYLAGQVADHEKVVALLEKQAAGGKDDEAKAFAADTLPTVKGHLEMARNLSHVGSHTTKHE